MTSFQSTDIYGKVKYEELTADQSDEMDAHSELTQFFSSSDGFPLSGVPIASTSNVDEAASIISARQAPVRVDKVNGEADFSFDINGRLLQRCFVGFNRFGADTLVRGTGEVEDAVVIIFGDRWRRSAYMEMEGERVGFSGMNAAIASPTRRGGVWRPKNSGAYVLAVSSGVLARRFLDVTGGSPDGRAVFDRSLDLSQGVGRSMYECFRGLVQEIERGELGERSLLTSLLEDTLINTVLALPGDWRRQLERYKPLEHTPRIVRMAEEYMSENVAEPITPSDLVDICACSSSTLFETFKSVRGYSPMQFLTSRRLELARQRLIGEPEASATAISLECGFNNYGRFSRAYREQFGETPAQSRGRRNRRL